MAWRTSKLALLPLLLLLLPALADEPSKSPAAKSVILSGEMTVSDALAGLTKQTGIVVVDRRGEPNIKITIDVNKATFWQALDQIADRANATVDLYAADGKLVLRKRTGQPLKGPQTVSYDGQFRTSIKRITASIDPETGQATYSAALEVAWEPTLQPFFLETRPQNLVVRVDDKELPRVDLGKAQAPVDGRNALLFEMPFPSLPRQAKQIGHIEGKLSVVAPSKMLTFTFADTLDKLAAADKPPTMEQEKVVCEVSKVTLGQDHWTVKLTLKYPPGNTELGSYQSWLVNNEMVLESKDGKTRFPATTYYLDPATATHAVVTYNFQDDPKQNRLRGKASDWKLTYRTPASVVTIPISFSFKDVPLP